MFRSGYTYYHNCIIKLQLLRFKSCFIKKAIKYTVIILCELATFIIYKQKLLLKGQCIVIDIIY